MKDIEICYEFLQASMVCGMIERWLETELEDDSDLESEGKDEQLDADTALKPEVADMEIKSYSGREAEEVSQSQGFGSIVHESKRNLQLLGLNLEQVQQLETNSGLIGDEIALAANKLLAKKYSDVAGFDAVTLYEVPWLRVKSLPKAANILYTGSSAHFVSTLYLTRNIIHYFDSLFPGSKPTRSELEQILQCYTMDNNENLIIVSRLCQKQERSVCLCHAVMNLDISLSGFDV